MVIWVKRSLWRVVVLVVLVGLIGASPAEATRDIRYLKKKGSAVALQSKEIAWRPASGTQAQTWIMWAWNKQGYLITAFFISTRFLMVSRFGVQLTIRMPSGKVVHRVKEYTLDKVKARKDRLSIRVNKQHFWLGGLRKGRIMADFGKWAGYLKYERVLTGFRAAEGPMKFGPKVFEGIPFGPRLKVVGAVRINGKRVAFKGIGYADYSLQTIVPKRLARRWYALRAMSKKTTIIASQLWATKRWRPTNVPMLSIARGKRWLCHCQPHQIRFRAVRIQTDARSKHRVPMAVGYRCTSSDKSQYRLTIKHKQQISRLDLMSHINPVLRFILKQLLSSPFVFRYKADVTLTIRSPQGKVTKEQLKGYSEWLFVQ